MENAMETLRVELEIERITALRLMNHFLDLAAAYAATDTAAARAAVNAIEADMARALFDMRDKFVEGRADHILAPVAQRLRETIQSARKKMAEAAKPH